MYSSTDIDLDLKYLKKNDNNEMTEESAKDNFVSVTDPEINKIRIEGYPGENYEVGSDAKDVSSLNMTFKNYIKSIVNQL